VPTLTLYGKPGCHLCDDARQVVERVCAGRDVTLEQVDITLDAVMARRFGEVIPVVFLDGEPLFELFVDADVLEGALDRVSA
jgi:glutaredoxin